MRTRLATVLILSSVLSPLPSAEPGKAVEFFERKIRPVLVEQCYECHSKRARRVRGGLLLDTRKALLSGGDSGPVLVPGSPGESLLLTALRHEDEDLAMPPKRKLPDEVIAHFERWIADGAVDPRVDEFKPGAAASGESGDASFWAFEVPGRHEASPRRGRDWPRAPIDRFILARLEESGISPSEPADRRAWLRRVSFDLTGLPPTAAELRSYLEDDSPESDARVVDRLLSSPHAAERWARLWLDVSRYAEDQAHIVGDNKSLFYPNAYLYRDWVIEALGHDLPYDEFLRLQLAADLLGDEGKGHEAALGFLGLGPKYYRRGDLSVMADEWEDRVDIVSRGLLGLTVACARCHDHKFDPIPTEDYYGLAGVFASTQMFNRPIPQELEPLDEVVETDAKSTQKKTKQKKAQKKSGGPEASMHVVREGKPRDLPVFIRGNVNQKGAVVPRRFLTALSTKEPRPLQSGSGRLELADAIVSRENPLASRVFVNRIWAEVFGRGLVDTPSNFGKLGSRPTHPRLLDDLAVRFEENGRSLKWLLRELTLSATYRQASRIRPEAERVDPENRLLWRVSRRRLPVESWRDSLLRASGRLSRAVGGPSIEPEKPDSSRRTVYSRISRFQLNPLLSLFDFPDPNAHSAGRTETTTPLQKLFAMNSDFIVRRGEEVAARVASELPVSSSIDRRVERLYELLFAREPSDRELAIGAAYLRSGEKRALPEYAQALLMSNEALFLD